MDDATRARLARCLDYHDAPSPTEADVRALWRAYQALASVSAQPMPDHQWLRDYAASASDGALTRDVRALLTAYDGVVGDATALADRLAACQVERDQFRNACLHWEDQAAIWHQEQAQAEHRQQALEAERDTLNLGKYDA